MKQRVSRRSMALFHGPGEAEFWKASFPSRILLSALSDRLSHSHDPGGKDSGIWGFIRDFAAGCLNITWHGSTDYGLRMYRARIICTILEVPWASDSETPWLRGAALLHQPRLTSQSGTRPPDEIETIRNKCQPTARSEIPWLIKHNKWA
jgi:hypothetical protein